MRARWAIPLVLLLAAPLPVGSAAEPATVDPLLRASFASSPTQLAILVLEPGGVAAVEVRLSRLVDSWHSYPHLEMIAVPLRATHVDIVAGWQEVRTVWRNEHMRPYLDRSAQEIGADVVWNTFRVRGAGVTALVVDTGIDGSHPDVEYGRNLIENVVPVRVGAGLIGGHREGVVSSDADGHGTHVAGIYAGTARAVSGDAAQGQYLGIANAARIIGFEAGLPDPDGEPSFDTTTVLEAYDYALAHQHRFDIRIVTNSWGTNGVFEPESPVNEATLRLYLAGMVVTFAAGNEGEQGPGSLNRYAVAPWVLGVGAGNYRNERSSFSSIGTDPSVSGKAYDHPDLLAPGSQITSAKAATDEDLVTGLMGPQASPARQLYATKSGTSMATPHVAGVAALLLSDNPNLSPDEVYDIIIGTAKPMPHLPTWEAGVGYLDALEAYRLAQSVPGGLDTFLARNVKYAGGLSGDPDHSEDPVSVGFGNGTAKSVQAPDTTIPEFARGLVSTPLGWALLIAVPLLLLLAFHRNEEGWISRRRGIAARPWLLVASWTLFGAVVVLAPRWEWRTSRYTGNVLVQLLIPDRLFDVASLFWLVAIAVGFLLLIAALRPGAMRRVHTPLFVLGLLLVVYGFLTFADARFTADRAPAGVAVFISLNYADLLFRPIQALIGLVLVAAGGVSLRFAFSRVEPLEVVAPARPGPPPARIEPPPVQAATR